MKLDRPNYNAVTDLLELRRQATTRSLPRRGGFIVALLAATFWTAGIAAAQNGPNLLTNGDFEIPPFIMPGTVANWVVTGGLHVAELQEGATSGTHSAAFSEGGDSQGNILTQTINTVVGQAYVFEFDSGVFGTPSGGSSLQLHFQVFGNNTQLDETLAVPVFNTAVPSQVEFHHYFRMFTADKTTTTIRFNDVGLGNANADVVVDSVSVTLAPTPTPAPTPTTLPLVNGDFETWPFNNPGTVAGWTVGGNKHIETITQGATSPDSKGHSAGFSVGGSSSNNILSQTFVTTPGQAYNIDFDTGVFGIRSGSPLQLQAVVANASPAFSATVTPPDNGVVHPSQVIFSHYHSTFVAGATVCIIQFTDLVGNNTDADLMLDSVSILPVAPTFGQWQASYFNSAQLNDPTISGWNADPDRDGIPNGFEYYFHLSPMAAPASDQGSLPTVGLMTSGGSTYLTFSYRRLLGWPGNQPIVAVSDDLLSWDLSQNQIEQVGAPARIDGFTELVTVRLKTAIFPGSIPRKFFRLRLTQ